MSAANAKLAAQLGVGPAEAARLSKVSADVYANAWGDSSETVNEAIRGVYQNIGDVSQAKGGLEGITTKALALSETFNQEVGPATAAAGQLMRTGLAKDADEAFDILSKGLSTSANKADDFLDTINEYSTQFRRIGLDAQTATGLLSQGLQHGARDADQVADAIGQFGELTLSSSSTVQAAFKSIGLNASDMAAKIGKGGKSGQQALQMTLDALRGTKDETVKLNAATALFGDPGTVMGDALFALDPASAAASSGMDKAAGSADKLVKTMGDTPAKTLERFKRQAMTKLAEVSGTFIQFAGDNKGVMEPLAYTLAGIAGLVLTIRAGMMVWTAAQAAWSAATAIATAVQWAYNAALLANPYTWIIIGIIALIAAIVLIATKTTWFQQIWDAIWGGLKAGWNATVAFFSAGLSWFGSLPGKFAGWFGSAKDWAVRKLMALVSWVTGLPGRLMTALASLAGSLRNRASSAFQAMRTAAAVKVTAMIGWVTGIPGRISRGVGSMASLLTSKGRQVVTGLWNGISSMGGWLYSKVANFVSSKVVGAAKSFLHIGSPSKRMADEIGHWIPAGVAQGVDDNSGVVDTAMRNMVNPQSAAPARPPLGTGLASRMGAQAGGGMVTVRVETTGAENAFKKFIRGLIRVDGRGSVQTFFRTAN
nr:phage tail tape measure protein [Streptomyces sp. C1-2]